MSIVARNLIQWCMDCEAKHILTSGSDSTCLGEIWKSQNLYLPVWNVLSVISVNMDPPGCQIWSSSVNSLLWFLDFLASSGWPKLFHQPSNWSIQWPLTLLIRLTMRCELLPASVSPLSLSHVLMDGEELDDKQYIWFQGCQSPQFHSVNRIATKAHVESYSKPWASSSLHSLKPTEHRRWFVK